MTKNVRSSFFVKKISDHLEEKILTIVDPGKVVDDLGK